MILRGRAPNSREATFALLHSAPDFYGHLRVAFAEASFFALHS